MPRAETRSSRLSPEAWVQAAVQVLVKRSIDAVRVEVLAKHLGVTKGSFYWHFKDRAELLVAILEHWRQRATLGVVERFERANLSVEQKLRGMIELPASSTAAGHAGTVELAIRAWARRDKLARQAVQQVDAERLRFVSKLLGELGYSEQEAADRAFILYSYDMGEALFGASEPRGDMQERMRYMYRLITTPPLDTQARPAARRKPLAR